MSSETKYDGDERRMTPDPATLAMKLDALSGDVRDMKDSLKLLTNAVTKLAVIEERLATYSAMHADLRGDLGLERERITLLQANVSDMKAESARNSQQTSSIEGWYERIAIALVSGGIAYVVALMTSGSAG
jgi:hypothetical protein